MIAKEIYTPLCASQNIPIFMQDWWLDATGKPWNVAIEQNGKSISGIWPYTTDRKAGVTIIRNPPLTPYLGPYIFFPSDLRYTKHDNFEHNTIKSLYAQLPKAKVYSTSLCPGLKQVGLFRNADFDIETRQTFLIDLQSGNEQELYLSMHEKVRYSIRKGSSEFLITNEPGKLNMLYNFLATTLKRKGLNVNFSIRYFQRLFEASYERGHGALWVAKKDNVIHAILWNVWDNTRAYNLVAAKNPDVKGSHAMTSLIWHASCYCKQLGKLNFDLEGSMDQGVEHFFRSFGARRELYLTLKRNKSTLWRMLRMVRDKGPHTSLFAPMICQ